MKMFIQLFLAVMVTASFNPAFSQVSSGGSSTQSTTTTNTVNVATQSVLDFPTSKALPQYANGLMANSSAPTLFQQNGFPASADGIAVTRFFYSLVPDIYVKDNEVISWKIDNTRYTFVPVGVNYTKNRDFKNNRTEDIRTIDVTALDPVPQGKCFLYPIGLIQGEALAKYANEVTAASLLSGLNSFAALKLKGHSNYRLLYYPAHLGANIGVVSSGKGFSFSPGASGVLQSTVAGGLFGIGNNSGHSYTEAMLHLTAMVFVEVKGEPNKQWPVVDLNTLQPKPTPPVPVQPEKPVTNTKVTVDVDLQKAIKVSQK